MPTRNLEKSREAYEKLNPGESKKAHNEKTWREPHAQSGKYIKSFVYGGLDGIITTFAVVAGVAGAALESKIVLILGFANLIADGLSMAVGDYLSTKAENDYNTAERKREEWETENYLSGEKKEMVEIYESKGVPKEEAEIIVEKLSKYKPAWIDVMMKEELGIIENQSSPVKNAAVTFGSFVVFGFVPLLTFVIAKILPALNGVTFPMAIVLTSGTLFILGIIKTKITTKKWHLSGLETLFVGGVAALVSYAIGNLLTKVI